ncbi:MAG: glycoside hydrolase, partial [Cyclobacteriaceae bacterium]|nr:glycoside hydrolase [Cyclobacteriaceae bacterium]
SCFVKTFTDDKVEGNKWEYIDSSSEPIELVGEWQVDFVDGDPKLPSSFKTNELKSWTVLGDSAAQSFAGTGKYTLKFNLPNVHADDWLLNLGTVRESAKVQINGQKIGTLWSFPFNISIGKYVQKGENILTIEVTNLSANRLRDLDKRGVDWEKFFFVDIFYENFDASNWPIMDSGLLGPVTLNPVSYINF